MLEGKEIQTNIGEYGRASVDVTPDLKIRIEVAVEFDLVAEAKKIALKTGTPVDDTAIAWLEAVMAKVRPAKAA